MHLYLFRDLQTKIPSESKMMTGKLGGSPSLQRELGRAAQPSALAHGPVVLSCMKVGGMPTKYQTGCLKIHLNSDSIFSDIKHRFLRLRVQSCEMAPPPP